MCGYWRHVTIINFSFEVFRNSLVFYYDLQFTEGDPCQLILLGYYSMLVLLTQLGGVSKVNMVDHVFYSYVINDVVQNVA